jgi:hypothetical protein
LWTGVEVWVAILLFLVAVLPVAALRRPPGRSGSTGLLGDTAAPACRGVG